MSTSLPIPVASTPTSTSTPTTKANPDNMLQRPQFDPRLGDPLTIFPMSNNITPTLLRSLPSRETLSAIQTAYPHLTHTTHVIQSWNTLEAKPHDIILSVLKSNSNRTGTGHGKAKHEKRPATYYIHGGGQISGTRFWGFQPVIRYFEEQAIDAVHISVEYRLAPEHRAPAALNDCYDGLAWVSEHADELGFDADSILLCGTSGGGPLAAGCAMLARENNLRVSALLLMTPMLDDRQWTVSARQFRTGVFWSGVTNEMAWDCILGRKNGDSEVEVSEFIAPARATDLSGLPPTFIDVGECEVFRDEVVAFAGVLWKGGVDAELHVWPGAWHGFDNLVPGAPVSKVAVAAKKDWVRRLFGGEREK